MTVARAAALYVRISDDKAEDAAGVRRQEQDCRALAQRHGWSVGEVYTENDTSAYKRRKVALPDGSTALRVVRPGFRRLLDDLASGAVDALVAYDLDRIARDPRDLEDLIDVVEARSIPTAAVTGEVNLATNDGKFMARMLVNVANKSSADTSRRVLRKQLELAEQGRNKGGGIRSYGYARDGVTIDEAEAEVLRDIAGRVLAGESLRSIAKTLNDAQVPTVRGGARGWDARSVHVVVSKARVAGLREHRGEVVAQAEWPAILDRDTWERVRMTLDARRTGTSPALTRWLTRVLRCGRCGHGLSGQVAQAQQNRGPRYWCAKGRGGCGGIAVDATKAEQHVEALVLAYLARPDVLSSLQAATSSTAVSAARDAVDEDQAQLRELAGMWAARSITTAEYMTARRDIEQRLERTQTLLKMALPGGVRQLLAEPDIEAGWHRLTPAGKREVVEVVMPSGIRVEPSTKSGLRGFDVERLVPVDWRTS